MIYDVYKVIFGTLKVFCEGHYILWFFVIGSVNSGGLSSRGLKRKWTSQVSLASVRKSPIENLLLKEKIFLGE